MPRNPENIYSPSPEDRKPLEIAPAKEIFTDEEYIRYREGAILANPQGKKFRIEGIGNDFETGEKMLVVAKADKSVKNKKTYEFIKSDELKDYKRILQDLDYHGEYFLHRHKPMAVYVRGCAPKKNAIILHDQGGKDFEVPYESFVKNYSELPDDSHAPFKHTWLMKKGTQEPVFISDIDIDRQSIEIVEIVRTIDTKSGKFNTIILPDTKKRISFDDMGKEFISVPNGPEELTFSFSDEDEDAKYAEAIEVEGTRLDERDTTVDSDKQDWEDAA
ncbi:MAG: hypothetical protein PHW53_03285 [Patescibacteria group bacterium]|nr:hypothetical protein [Patescibacteria group bacterium]